MTNKLHEYLCIPGIMCVIANGYIVWTVGSGCEEASTQT